MNISSDPYYLLDKQKLDSNLKNCKESLKSVFKDGICSYSVKTNSLPWLLKYISSLGYFMEVVSPDEFKLVRALGIPFKKIIYNGPCKDFESFSEAVLNGSIVNIDSENELNWLSNLNSSEEKRIGIRINVDLNNLLPQESKYSDLSSRFGFDSNSKNFENILKKLNKVNNLKIIGIHMHCNTKFRSLDVYKILTETFCKIINKHELDVMYFDIGGGFYGDVLNQPCFSDYFKMIKEIIVINKKSHINLIVEPGSSIIASPFSFYSRVIDTKKINNTQVVVINCSRNDIDPFFQKKDYFVSCKSSSENIIENQLLCGYTCLESDRFLTLENCKQLLVGDSVIFDKVGAYTMTLTPLFINYFPIVYLKDKDKLTIIREKWTTHNYLTENDII